MSIYRKIINICLSNEFPEMNKEDIENLLNIAIDEKVFPTIYSYIVDKIEIDDKFHNIFKDYKQKRADALVILKILDKKRKALEIDYLLLKGLGIENYYSKQNFRHFADLDICVPSEKEFWEIGNRLLEKDFNIYSTVNLCKNKDNNRIYGSARFESLYSSPLKGAELQIGRFPLTIKTFISWDILTYNQRNIFIDGVESKIPGPEVTFILNIGELLTRSGEFYLRDTLDIIEILNVKKLDIDFILKNIKKLNLYPALKILESLFYKYEIPLPPTLVQILKEFRFASKNVVIGHIIPFLKKQNELNLKNIYLLTIRKVTYFLNDRDKFLFYLRKIDEKNTPFEFFNNAIYIYFMKIHEHQGTYEWVNLNNDHLVITPIGTFLACMHALHSDEELDILTKQFEEKLRREVYV
ncbi:nucleotidyltransferase family protein [Priestia flexa]|uniref:nucleotidyltransferase family protein n=1 Tax=Priestia flexa TaxID=86664 RepID=UPI00077CB343|nr:nucleotidyltransferase family protein [Priestia flexa]MED4590511.1 nucleotidyltransferase family protein [Priestia flexa]